MKRAHWLKAWLIQLLEMALAGLLTALAHIPGGPVSLLAAWIAMPLLGAVSAAAATVRGLLNYAAWLLPPVCMTLAHIILWKLPPDPGPVLLCAFVSLVGAAAGQVMKERNK
ncbi:MAG: hypothetical protein IJH78_02450 [Clostridia bacterium]|nr:hypothetical protein [Clostridia bacterium]